MNLRLGRPRSLLVIAPHPDDETIGAFGLIAHCRRRGIPVRILVASDGAGSHPTSVAWPRRRLVAERQRESLQATRRSRVPAGAVNFLGLPDGGLSAMQIQLSNEIGRAIRRAPKPMLIAAPLANDEHADHRAVAAAIATTRARGVRVLGYPVWPAGAATARRSCTIVLSSCERLSKRRTIESYRTQAGRIVDDPSGFAMTRSQIAAFSRAQEHFVEVRR